MLFFTHISKKMAEIRQLLAKTTKAHEANIAEDIKMSITMMHEPKIKNIFTIKYKEQGTIKTETSETDCSWMGENEIISLFLMDHRDLCWNDIISCDLTSDSDSQSDDTSATSSIDLQPEAETKPEYEYKFIDLVDLHSEFLRDNYEFEFNLLTPLRRTLYTYRGLVEDMSPEFFCTVRDAFFELTDNEQYVLDNRLCLSPGTKKLTQAVIAEHLGLTKQRISQIEVEAQDKLRHNLVERGIKRRNVQWFVLNAVFPLFTGKTNSLHLASACLNPVMRVKFSRPLLDFFDDCQINSFHTLESWVNSAPTSIADELNEIIEKATQFRESCLKDGKVTESDVFDILYERDRYKERFERLKQRTLQSKH